MITNYALFYSYKNIGDVLLIVINNEEKTKKVVQKNDVFLLYNEKDELIGINIFNISKIVKIKGDGLIYLPNNILIELINNVILKPLNYSLTSKTESGYVIGKIINIAKDFIEIDTKDATYKFKNKNYIIKIDDYVVILKDGYYLNNGKRINKSGYLCTEKDLSISDEDKLFTCYDKMEIGEDFYKLRS